MKHFRKIWNQEMHDFLLEHKTMNRTELYSLFLERFNNPDVTFIAFCNERSRIGAVNYISSNHSSRLAKPLGYESTKKGYVRIKIEQPNKWIFKQVYIWNQHNPENKVIPKKELVIFLDGNNRNFDIKNLYKMSRKIAAIFNRLGGTVKGKPEETLFNIKRAELKHQIYNRARQFGLINDYGQFPEYAHNYYIQRRSKMSELEKQEYRKKQNERMRNFRKKLKLENPEAYQKLLDKTNERRRRRKQNDK